MCEQYFVSLKNGSGVHSQYFLSSLTRVKARLLFLCVKQGSNVFRHSNLHAGNWSKLRHPRNEKKKKKKKKNKCEL
jgi:hypothetical protein